MRTKASFGGHPVHPMLVVFPLALFTVGFAALIGCIASDAPFWFHLSYLALLLGAAVGAIAAAVGLIDLFDLPRDSRAKAVGVFHAGAALLTIALFFGAGLSMRTAWTHQLARTGFSIALPLVLAIGGFGILVLAGALGWQLIGAHHVGVSPVPGRTGRIPLAGPLRRAVVAGAPRRFTPGTISSSNAIAVLRDQHAELAALFARAIDAAPEDRAKLVVEIGNRFSAHAAIEETLLYPTFATGDAAYVLDDYARDHQRIRGALAKLCEHPSRVTAEALGAARELVLQHELDEEDGQLLPLVERTLSAAQLDQFGAEMIVLYAQLVQRAPWRTLRPDARHAARL